MQNHLCERRLTLVGTIILIVTLAFTAAAWGPTLALTVFSLPIVAGVYLLARPVVPIIQLQPSSTHHTPSAETKMDLLEHLHRLHTILEQIPIGVATTDSEGNVLAANLRFTGLLGLTPSQLAPSFDQMREWPTKTHDDRPLAYEEWPIIRALRQGETTHNLELRVSDSHGDWVDLSVSAAPLRNADNSIAGGVLVLNDLRQVRDAQQKANEHEKRLRLLESVVVNAHDAVVVMEAKPQPNRGRAVLYVNRAFTDLTGYTAEEVIGRSLHFLRGPRTEPATLSAMRAALDNGTPFRGELLNYRKDGGEIWVSISLVPVSRPDGEREHFVMIQRDITSQKRAEESLQRSEARFRSIFEMAGAGVSLTDASGKFVACNPAFAAILGRPMEDVLGHHPSEFTHAEDWQKQNQLFEQILSKQITQYSIRKRYLRPDGSTVWSELSLVAYFSPTGDYEAGLGVSVDVTQRMALEEQLRQSQKMEALGQLAGGVAHDFNNLLTAILGNLSLIQIDDTHPAHRLLRTVELASSRAADLTRKLLGYARRNQLITAPTTPHELLDEVIEILQRTLDPRIEIRTRIQTELCVPVDATLLHQCLFNLCLNARDAMPNGGTLTLGAEMVDVGPNETHHPDAQPGPYVLITVADTGTGMTDEVKQHIFEPFFTTKGVGRGTGLGLPMVQGIIQQHLGWVTVDSKVGCGTVFQLYLPTTRPSSATVLPTRMPNSFGEVTPPPVGRLGALPPADQLQISARVLLVDDELMIRTLGRAILESKGIEVLEAEDGAAAVEVFTQERESIDLVILDLTMPRLSGRDAFQQITRIDPSARVLFSSGYSAEDLTDVDGAIGLLSKPYRPNDLISAVRRALSPGTEVSTAG